jgi:hypothetical protein
MNAPQPGERRTLRLPLALAGDFDDYDKHNGQVVTIERSYGLPSSERHTVTFYVLATDGWRGAVFLDELQEIAP